MKWPGVSIQTRLYRKHICNFLSDLQLMRGSWGAWPRCRFPLLLEYPKKVLMAIDHSRFPYIFPSAKLLRLSPLNQFSHSRTEQFPWNKCCKQLAGSRPMQVSTCLHSPLCFEVRTKVNKQVKRLRWWKTIDHYQRLNGVVTEIKVFEVPPS